MTYKLQSQSLASNKWMTIAESESFDAILGTYREKTGRLATAPVINVLTSNAGAWDNGANLMWRIR